MWNYRGSLVFPKFLWSSFLLLWPKGWSVKWPKFGNQPEPTCSCSMLLVTHSSSGMQFAREVNVDLNLSPK